MVWSKRFETRALPPFSKRDETDFRRMVALTGLALSWALASPAFHSSTSSVRFPASRPEILQCFQCSGSGDRAEKSFRMTDRARWPDRPDGGVGAIRGVADYPLSARIA